MNEGGEHHIELFETWKDASKGLEAPEETLDLVTLFIKLFVILPLVEAVGFWWTRIIFCLYARTLSPGVLQRQVADAWNAQFKASVTESYDGLADEQAKFVAMFGPLGKGFVQTVEIDGDTTRAIEDGLLKGTIEGKEFQRAFLSMWFGSKPVLPSLKKDLLSD